MGDLELVQDSRRRTVFSGTGTVSFGGHAIVDKLIELAASAHPQAASQSSTASLGPEPAFQLVEPARLASRKTWVGRADRLRPQWLGIPSGPDHCDLSCAGAWAENGNALEHEPAPV